VLDKFNGEKDGIISILRFDSFNPTARQLKFLYDIRIRKNANLIAEITFQNVKTSQKWTLPTDFEVKKNEYLRADGIKAVTLPKDLPNGRYRVFYDYLREGKIVGVSHYFETDL
jgi:hypothetical protein